MHVFRHPKYYKELRERNKSDQAISSGSEGSALPQRAPDQGQTNKQQASSSKLTETNCHDDKNQEQQASSRKLQAPSSKLQAPSHKRQAP